MNLLTSPSIPKEIDEGIVVTVTVFSLIAVILLSSFFWTAIENCSCVVMLTLSFQALSLMATVFLPIIICVAIEM